MAIRVVPDKEMYKREGETLDYDFDFIEFLSNGDDEIVSSAVTVSPAGLTAGPTVNGVGIVKKWLSGGTVGAAYEVACTITTASGRIKTRKLILHIIAG